MATRRKPLRKLLIEPLENRALLTAEGQSFALDRTVDCSDLATDISAMVNWGDGTTSPGTIQSAPLPGALKFRIDYSMDSSGFFADADRRAILQTTADLLSAKFSDSLLAIQPQAGDTWIATLSNPTTGADITKTNLSIAANEILVFVGSRDLPNGEGGVAEFGGFSVSSPRPAFIDAVRGRGQTGALSSQPTDVGPWGGSLAFDAKRNWYFGADPTGLQPTQLDFPSVVTHELLHLMGLGIADSWFNRISNSKFAGPSASSVFGGNVPLANESHFANTTQVDGRRPVLVQTFTTGERLLPSRLDLAAMQDIGWQLIPQNVRVTTNHTYGDNGDFIVNVGLQSSKLGRKTNSATASISNANPVLSAISDKTATAGVQLSLPKLGQFTDLGFGIPTANPPTSELFTYRIDWGDGSNFDSGTATISNMGSPGQSTTGFFDGSHTYAAPGSYNVTARVTDDDGGFNEKSFQVVVASAGKVSLSLDKTSILENGGAGAAVLTITRSGTSLDAPLVVQLSSSDTTEAVVPAMATIPAGQASTTVSVSAVDDTLLDGTQVVVFSPSAGNLEVVTVSIQVTDIEPLVLTTPISDLNEDVPDQASTLVTIGLPGPAPAGGVVLKLAGSPAILSFPSTLTIPAGAAQGTVIVSTINDNRPSNPRTVGFTASADGYFSAILNFVVRDNDPAFWTNPTNPFDVDKSGRLDPLDVLTLIDEINRRGSRVLDPTRDNGLLFVDPNRDGSLDPLDVLFVIDEINRR